MVNDSTLFRHPPQAALQAGEDDQITGDVGVDVAGAVIGGVTGTAPTSFTDFARRTAATWAVDESR